MLKGEIESQSIHKWQVQWETEEHGRETYSYIYDMTFAHNNRKWFRPNRYATYLITGCGPINSTLCRRKLANSTTCLMCGEVEETTEHIIFDYTAYERIRFTGIESYKMSGKKLISNERMLAKFNELARKIFYLRRKGRRNESRRFASSWQGQATPELSSDG